MKALILVGGYGTRLRPLTLSVPKPLIHFCNKSIVEHQIEALVGAGVTHVILAVAYQPQAMMEALHKLEVKFNIKISCSREDEPLGTAGPICLARDLLESCESQDESKEDSFFVFNSDVICKFPLKEMLAFHRSHAGEGTILTTTVTNPSNFGVILSDNYGRVEKFVEKPVEFVGNDINAGLYILRKSTINRIQLRPTSIEKEIFPQMAVDKTLYSYQLKGYWADIGQPKDFLNGVRLYLESLKTTSNSSLLSPTPSDIMVNGNQCLSPETTVSKHRNYPIADDPESQSTTNTSAPSNCSTPQLSSTTEYLGNVLIDPSVRIGKGCKIGPDVTVGYGCSIGDGVRISNAAIMEKVKIQDNSYIDGAIVGWESLVGQWVRIEGLTVVGEDVRISEGCFINGAFILPHKMIQSSIYEAGKVIM